MIRRPCPIEHLGGLGGRLVAVAALLSLGSPPMEQITRTPKQLGTLLLRRRRERSLSEEALASRRRWLRGGAGFEEALASRIHLRQATVSAPENPAVDRRRGTLFDTLWALDLELLVRPRSKGSAREVEQ